MQYSSSARLLIKHKTAHIESVLVNYLTSPTIWLQQQINFLNLIIFQRRIRMIFIEGKLKSWGRAELVIKILDNDLPEEDISLEDVVEAVRNCQDRNSALAYLQQECALCFTNFPMSKVRLHTPWFCYVVLCNCWKYWFSVVSFNRFLTLSNSSVIK